MMHLDETLLTERYEILFGKPETIDELTRWQLARGAFRQRPAIGEDIEIDTDEGVVCLVDGKRVPFLHTYLEKFRMDWFDYRKLFDLGDDSPWFSRKYLVAYQEKALEGRERPDYAVRVEDSLGWDRIVNLVDGSKSFNIARRIETVFGISWKDYLLVCGLPDDYPSTAPAFGIEKREVGRKRTSTSSGGVGRDTMTSMIDVTKAALAIVQAVTVRRSGDGRSA